MKKLLALLLVLSLAVYSFPAVVLADYVIGNASQGDLDLNDHIDKYPVEVVVTERVSRYAVDVIYGELSIDVKSAIWNVNEYVYDVEMHTTAEETTTPLETDSEDDETTTEDSTSATTTSSGTSETVETEAPPPNLVKTKPITVTIVNHSDKAILAQFTPKSNYSQITFEQDPIFWNQVTVPGVLFVESPAQTLDVGVDAQAERFPSYLTSVIIPTETYEGGWQNLINELIRDGRVQNGESVVGSITITISPQ